LDALRGFGEELEVSTSTFETILEFDFISVRLAQLVRGKYWRTKVFPELSRGTSKGAEMA